MPPSQESIPNSPFSTTNETTPQAASVTKPNLIATPSSAEEIQDCVIRDLNMHYLMAAKQIIAADKMRATFLLGVHRETVELIDRMTPAQVMKLANCGTLLCTPRIRESAQWSAMLDQMKVDPAGSREKAMNDIRNAIIVCGSEIEPSGSDSVRRRIF